MLSKEQINNADSFATDLIDSGYGYSSSFSAELVSDLISMLRDAQKDVARIDWLESRKKLELYSDNSTWTREDGSQFTNSHRLAESCHMHGTGECLRDIIDAAMQQSSTQNKT